MNNKCFSQLPARDSIHFDYKKIYGAALDGNDSGVLALTGVDSARLSEKDRAFKRSFDARFRFATDRTRYPENASPIDDLLKLYVSYWRSSLLEPSVNSDTPFARKLTGWLSVHYPPAAGLKGISPDDTIDHYLKGYLASLHLYTTGFSKTGRIIDLIIWQAQHDTTYRFSLSADTTLAPVCFMTNFITLGWEEYATLGRYYPGGWATPEKLFCVEKAYDLHSESFRISYLAHESRHFGDYLQFPKLKSPDLEYRAKLTELGMANTTLMKLIDFFIANANFDSGNGHSVADYCVIRDLSRALFGNDFERDLRRWEQLAPEKINAAAAKTLEENTAILKARGRDVTSYIK